MAKIAVAPLVGAWIEISGMIGTTQTHWVAPLVGAWIEIYYTTGEEMMHLRRSPRGSVD